MAAALDAAPSETSEWQARRRSAARSATPVADVSSARQALGGGSYSLSCDPPVAQAAAYVVALVGVSGYTAQVALPTNARDTQLRFFGVPDDGAAPLAGPAAGGTQLTLTGFGFTAADALTCTFVYDYSARPSRPLPPASQR